MIIGLTGGIASGKSTAATYLKSKGASVLDGDVLGHRAYEPHTQAYREVVAAFGPEVVAADGAIDRKVLGGKVFGNPDALDRLTGILWPEIRRMAEAEIAALLTEDPARPVVLEAAVLFEAGWEDAVDEVWVAIVDIEAAVARAMERDGADETAIRNRIASQLSNEERRRRADIVIDNNGDEAMLRQQLDAQWARISPAS
ncbi:MAG: dephospho-CoA kinase [Rhodospirillaceae bacterium]|jgi:dephospho-CoA kinase|nr:dephospho-CoA kinase [Rhodospirillaceae bacterium]MBT5667589.1 dephospho-CoA kinase [Rhodospirillaceae bacterium]MBT5809229.1 dephospho-CoA kinase [Rhodospirillaceae bacterium]